MTPQPHLLFSMLWHPILWPSWDLAVLQTTRSLSSSFCTCCFLSQYYAFTFALLSIFFWIAPTHPLGLCLDHISSRKPLLYCNWLCLFSPLLEGRKKFIYVYIPRTPCSAWHKVRAQWMLWKCIVNQYCSFHLNLCFPFVKNSMFQKSFQYLPNLHLLHDIPTTPFIAFLGPCPTGLGFLSDPLHQHLKAEVMPHSSWCPATCSPKPSTQLMPNRYLK